MSAKKSATKSPKKKLIWRIVIFILIAGLGYGFYYIYARLPIITAYSAKDMCSCVFIADRDPADVQDNEFQFSLVKYANAEVDMEKKSVTATVWGMGAKTAYYHPQKGCSILNNTSSDEFLKIIEGLSDVQINNRTIDEDLDNANIDYTVLNDAVNKHFKDTDPEKPFGTRAILVLHNGHLIAETYADGFDKNSLHLGWSMTKSIFSALIGRAIQQDYISSVEENELFKEWKSDDRKEITLKQLLQMNSGIEWTENYGDISEATIMLYENDDMVKYAKSCDMEAKPGEHWEYSSGSTNLLSGLLRQRMNYETYFNYPYSELFAKIGAPSFRLETDAAGNYVASSYAWATARDWAKFGQLYLDQGMANNENLFPEGWIQFTKEAANDSKGGYGAQFWLPTKEEYPTAPEDMYFADGFQGQRIFIIPSAHVVIVRLGLSRFEQPNYDEMISDILSAIHD
ncbi:MAG: serine hydrolase [Flavobacteriales bacterium]|nr:serine hydrolase [Flavobacteriales bacterium]